MIISEPTSATFSTTEPPAALTLAESDLSGEAHVHVPPNRSGAAVKIA